MNFYRLEDDLKYPGRWHLNEPRLPDGTEVDPECFTNGSDYVGSRTLTITMYRRGTPLDFTFGPREMPVVSGRLAIMLRKRVLPVQFIPIHI